MQEINISNINPNHNNPRIIKDDKFKKLVKSIKDFPEMLQLRPIVIDETNTVLGGNMRLKALRELGYKDVPVIYAKDLTEEQKKEFIIKDNVGFGEWDFDALGNEWETEKLEDWGLDLPNFETDFSEKNKEIDIDEMDTEMVINLKYSEDEYNIVKGQLLKLAATPEQAVWKLLGNE